MSLPLILLVVTTAALLAAAGVAWRRRILAALPFVVLLNGVAIPVGGRAMHAEQFAVAALVVALGAALLSGARRLRWDATMTLLSAILLLNVVATALHSPAKSYSTIQCVNLALAWATYAVVVNYLDGPALVEAFLRRAMWAAIVGCGIAIGAFVLGTVGLHVGGAETGTSAAVRLTNAYGAYGTMIEPNILGGFAAAYLVLSVALLAAPAGERATGARRGVETLSAIVAGLALLLSFTRAAWLAAAAGLLLLAAGGAFGQLRVRRIALPVSVVAIGVVAVLVIPGDSATLFRFKLLNLVNVDSQTAVMRLITYALALQQTVDHWVIGWGTFTFAPLAAEGTDFQQFDNWHNLWIGNYLLLALHDTGVVGLTLWIGLIASILRRARRAQVALRAVDPRGAAVAVGLTGAVAALLVAFLSTSGFSLAYPWMLIGLLSAWCRVRPEVPEPSGSSAATAPDSAGGLPAPASLLLQ